MNYKILIVDDTEEIHEVIVLLIEGMEEYLSPKQFDSKLSSILHSGSASETKESEFLIEHSYQGEEAIEKIKKSLDDGEPYDLIFMDVKMPPGIDGIETIKRSRELSTDLNFIICTAFNNYSWEDLQEMFGLNDKILYLSKPFDDFTFKQMTSYVLAKKNN